MQPPRGTGPARASWYQPPGDGQLFPTEKPSFTNTAEKRAIAKSANLLHGPGLGGGSDTGHGQTDVDGRTNALVEQLGLQEDLNRRVRLSDWEARRRGPKPAGTSEANLPICDGDDISWNVGRHVTGLGLDNGKSRQGAAPKIIIHLRGSFQETGMQVEDVSGVSLTTGGTTKQEGHLAVGDGLRSRET